MSVTITTSSWHMLRGFEPMSLCDWPGRVSCVLFFGGCNLRCPTCHNQNIAWYPGSMPPVDPKKVLDSISLRKDWLDGIVLTGGEVTVLSGLLDVLADIRKLGLEVKMDTNGMDPEAVRRVLQQGLAEMIAVDVKGPWAKYPQLTGNQVTPREAGERMERVFGLAAEEGDKFYFRCTRVPALTPEDLEDTVELLPQGAELHFQEYVPPHVENGKENEETVDTAETKEQICPSR